MSWLGDPDCLWNGFLCPFFTCNCSCSHGEIVLMICFPCFLSLLNIKIERAIHFSHSGIKKSFSEVALRTRESLKRPYFPLPLSILAGTNLIMLLLLFFCNPRLILKKIHPPFDFRENSSSFDFRENPCKTPHENQKNCFFLCSLCFLDLF